MAGALVHMFGAAAAGAGEEYFLPPEKLLAGNPRQTVWMDYTDPSGRFMTGTWHSEPGRWKILYTEEEYFRVLEGRSVITDQAGTERIVSAGEECVIPAGFAGIWEVVESTRKRFVIYEPGSADVRAAAGANAQRT
jgi:uncharacterized cupin superfamily protein